MSKVHVSTVKLLKQLPFFHPLPELTEGCKRRANKAVLPIACQGGGYATQKYKPGFSVCF